MLCVILLLLVIARLTNKYWQTYPQTQISCKELKLEEERISVQRKKLVRKSTAPIYMFKEFNPNRIQANELIEMGIPKYVAGNWEKYILAGGKFTKPEEISIIYGINDALYNSLLPFVKIPPEAHHNSKVHLKKPLQVDLNCAHASELASLPGVGAVLSQRIVKYRKMLGGFVDVKQLHEVYGISDSLAQAIMPLATIDTSQVMQINLSTCNIADLYGHPYISSYQAKAIINYRESMKHIPDKRILIDENLLDETSYLKVQHYLKVE